MIYRSEVLDAVRDRPHLRPVFHHVLDIPRRLYEYHPDLFLVFNRLEGSYEVHSLGQRDDTFAMTVRYRHLDERLLRDVRRNDVRAHGRKILQRIRQSQENWRRRRERNWHNWVEDVAKETRTIFARASWEGSRVVSGRPGKVGL